ncbi:MAG: hypothetical protein N2578_03360 [Bdellovibrionaceae bacterium]|nr:hypothetical protein [Pseudobdellovibrionaceae bacterium]
MKTPILLLGPWPKRLENLGASIYHDPVKGLSLAEESEIAVLGLTLTHLSLKSLQVRLEKIIAAQPAIRLVAALPPETPAAQLVELHKKWNFCRITASPEAPEAESLLIQAMEDYQEILQSKNLDEMLIQQQQINQKLHEELEHRIEKRQRSLSESRARTAQKSRRLEVYRRLLLDLQRAQSISDMEVTLQGHLAPDYGIFWARILTGPLAPTFSEQIQRIGGFEFLVLPFGDNGQGHMIVFRELGRAFNREEKIHLSRIADAVGLAVDRLLRRSEAQLIQKQWESAFRAISDPVIIINSERIIEQSNKGPVGVSCFQALFGRKDPCPNCRLGTVFHHHESGKHPQSWEVHSSPIRSDDGRTLYINRYHEVSERLRMEAQLLESAKQEELGLIASSIAHELNNPLAGILSFSQILKSELKPTDPLWEDVVHIEKAAEKSREIVQQLLRFSRMAESPSEELDILSLLQQTHRAIELHLKSVGGKLEIVYGDNPQPIKIKGKRLLLIQALSAVFRTALHGQSSRDLKIHIRSKEDKADILIQGPNHDPLEVRGMEGLSLSLAGQIFQDHGARLDFLSPSSPEYWAIISFSRPVFRS